MFKYIWLTFLTVAATGALDPAGAVPAAARETARRGASDDLQRVLSWLPVDTEAISMARGPFTLATPPMPDWTKQTWDPNKAVPDQQLTQDFENVPFLLFAFKNGLLSKRLQGKRVLLAVEGSRHFRAPAGLGLGPFEGCAIVVFADDIGNDASLPIRETRKAALRVEKIQGQQVSVFQEKSEEDTWTTFVAFPNKRVVLVASDRDYLKEVLNRLQNGSGERALPSDLPEWKYVDIESRFWGLRHYDRSQAKTDPTSPIGGRLTGKEPDEKAIGITFVFDPSRGRLATITYLSGDKSLTGKASPLLALGQEDAKGLNIQVREIAPGVEQGSYSLERIEPIDTFIFLLSCLLGHAIYL